MEHVHLFRRQLHLLPVQDIEILHAHVVFLVEETLLLDTGHVQDIQFRQGVFEADHLFIGDLLPIQDVLAHIIRKP